MTPWQAAAAVSFAILPPSKYSAAWREMYRLLLAGYFSMNRSMIWIRSQWDSNVYERNYAYFRMLAIKDLPLKQLYIYSAGDTICTPDSIDYFINAQKERNANIEKLYFDDTLHCQHYRLYPDKYKQACLNFINHDDKLEN